MSEAWRPVLDFLNTCHVASLAVCRGGAPHACSLMYVHRGFTLYWMSDPDARHSQVVDEARSTTAAVTMAPDYADFSDIRGIQMTGMAHRVSNAAEASYAMTLFTRRYEFMRLAGERSAVLDSHIARAKLYCFIPDTVAFIDNTVRFGTKTNLAADEILAAFETE